MALGQAISRNRISLQLERAAYMAGFTVLISLLVWVTTNDISGLVT